MCLLSNSQKRQEGYRNRRFHSELGLMEDFRWVTSIGKRYIHISLLDLFGEVYRILKRGSYLMQELMRTGKSMAFP